MKRFFALLLILAMGICNAQKSDTEKKLSDIERLLFIKPDSAKVLISQVLTIKKQHDTVYAMANIYNGYYYLVKNNPDSSIFYYQKALDYSLGLPAYRARILRLMAAPYRKKAGYSKSLQLLDRSEKEYLAINDPKGLATVYGEIAANYNAMLRPQDAIPYLTKAISLFEKSNNTKDQLPIKQSLANSYLNIGNYAFAADLYKETLEGFKEVGMHKNYYLTLINYSECLINLDKADAARTLLTEAIAGLEQFNDKELIGSVLSTLGRLEIQERNFLKGEVYAEKAFNILSSIHSARTIPAANMYLLTLTYMDKTARAKEIIKIVEEGNFRAKANLNDLAKYEKSKIDFYKKTGDPEMALESARTAIKLMDSLGNVRDEKAVISMQAKIQQEFQSEKKSQLDATNAKLKKSVAEAKLTRWMWVFLPILVLLLIITFYYYTKAGHMKKVAEAGIAITDMTKRKQSARKLNETLKATIYEKQGELDEMRIQSESMQDSINTMIDPDKMPSGHRNTDDIENIKRGLNRLVTEDDYRFRFDESFSVSNAAFEKKLLETYPQLTRKELQFCSLLTLNLPYKDLAVILNVVPEAVRKRKYRIRKKMGISEDQDLEHILAQHNKK